MRHVLYFNPSKSVQILIDGGFSEDAAIETLVAMKGGIFTMQYDGTTYFDPRELRRIVQQKRPN